jgi:sugar phosphate isomerase/epimerase
MSPGGPPWRLSLATSPAPSPFGPLLFSGRLAEAVQAAASLGLQGIEISLRSAQEVDADELEGSLAAAGLTLSALGSGRVFLEEGLSFSDPDATVRRAAMARLEEHIGLAARFGAPVIVGLVRGSRTAEGDTAGAMRLIVRAVRECADLAASLGTSLVVEAINRYETTFLNTCQETLGLLELVDRPNLGVLLDLFHMNIEEVSLPAAIEQAGEKLAYLHLVDSNRWAPGQGHLDYPPVLRALENVGYEGWVSAEILPRPDDWAAIRQWRAAVDGWFG